MKFFTNIWNYTREVWSFRHEPEHFRKLADFYWRALLVLAALIVIGSGTYGVMKFMAALQEREDALGPSGGGVPLLNKKDLEATLEGFAARAAAYESFKTTPPKIADPSR